MELWQAALLGCIQGLTEFLPVSSSGHLALGQALLNINNQSILFEVTAHLGTLFAVITVFSRDLLWLIKGFFALFLPRQSDLLLPDRQDELALQYIGYLIWATLPIILVGLFFRTHVEAAFKQPLLVGCMLLVTGAVLLISRFGSNARGRMTLRRSIGIGITQAFAVLPGISRSGSTIAVGMLMGVERTEAARFSFLMSVPAILGAFVMQMIEIPNLRSGQIPHTALAVGFISSYVAGFFAIKALLKVVQKGRFDYFAWYCFAIGGFALYILTKGA